MANPLGILEFIFRANIASLRTDMAQAQTALKTFGKEATAIGKTISTYVSAPLAILGGLAIKTAVEFETAFAGVRKTLDATPPQLEKIRQSILAMSKDMPQTAVEMAKIAEEAGALGISNDAIAGFVKTMAGLGVATNLTSDRAADLFARFTNITGLAQTNENFEKLGNVLVGLGNGMAGNEDEIIDMSLRLAQAGHVAGLSETQIMGFASSLTALGITSEVGGTAFSKFLTKLQQAAEHGGEELEKFAHVARMSITDFKDLFEKDAAGAVLKFLQGLGQAKQNGELISDLLDGMKFKTAQLTRTLTGAATGFEQMAKGQQIANDALAQNNALTEEVRKRNETLSAQWAIFTNNLKDVAIEMGDVFLPVLKVITEGLKVLSQSLQGLDPDSKIAVISVTGLLSILGPLIFVVGTLATLLGGEVIIAVAAFTAALILGTAAGVGLVRLLSNVTWDNFVNGLEIIAEKMEALHQAALNFVWTTFQDAVKGTGIVLDDLGDTLAIIGNAVADFAEKLGSAFSTKIGEIIGNLEKLGAALQSYLVDKLSGIVDAVGNQVDRVSNFFSGLLDKVYKHSFVPDLIDGIASEFAKLPKIMTAVAEKETAETATAFKRLQDQYESTLSQIQGGKIEDAIRAAVQAQDSVGLENWLQALRDHTYDGVLKGLDESIRDTPAAQALAAKMADAEVAERRTVEQGAIADIRKKGNEDAAKNLDEEYKKAHADHVKFLEGALALVNHSSSVNWKEEMEKAAEEFGVQFVANMLDGNKTIAGSLQSALGSIIEKNLPGFSSLLGGGDVASITSQGSAVSGAYSAGSSIFGGGSAAAGAGASTGGLASLSTAVPLLAAAAAGLYIAGENFKNLSSDFKGGGSRDKTAFDVGTAGIDTVAPGIGTGINKIFGGLFGGGGNENSEAIKSVQNYLNQALSEAAKNGTNQLTGAGGNPLTNIDLTSFKDQFTDGWADQFWNDFGDKGGSSFIALGQGLTDFLGLTSAVGPQIGAILATQFSGNIDQARLLMQSLGLTTDQLADSIIKAGLAQNKTWLEIDTSLFGLSALAGEGLVAVGDLRGAYDLLIQSGGRGMTAIQALKDLAIEALEAGATTLEGLETKLRASGKFTSTEIQTLMQALRDHGINSIEDLKGATTQNLGAIVGELQALGVSFNKDVGDNIDAATESTKQLSQNLDQLPSKKSITIDINYQEHGKPDEVPSVVPPTAKKNAKGGVFGAETGFNYADSGRAYAGVLGENGPEAVLPLERGSDGRLGLVGGGAGKSSGGGGNVYIEVDARNATPGVEGMIRQSLASMQDQIALKTVKIIHGAAKRR
jgi:TP901 family phage tail tape measure protein